MTTHHAETSNESPLDVRDVEEGSRRVSRFVSILYLCTALAAPLLLYYGPDVLSPTAPAIANAALDGRFAVQRAACVTAASAGAHC